MIAIDARLIGGTSTGDSTYWSGLLHGFVQTQPNARLLLFSNSSRPVGIPWCEQFEWIQVPSRSSRWWSIVLFPLAARKRRAQVIHTQYSLSPLVGARGITTIHDVSFFVGPGWFNPKDRILLQRSVPASVRRARRVITVSNTSLQELIRFVPEAACKSEAIYNACPPWIQAVPRDEAASYLSSNLGIDAPYLLTVGTRWPRKNMNLAIEAAEALPKDLPHRLLVTGKAGWGEESVGRRTVSTGYLSNEALSKVYSAADLYLAPSHHEGFGIPLLEAFRCGCPVLCSIGGALPEVAASAAAIEPTWEPDHWSRTIAALLEDRSKLEAMRREGYAREAQFTWKEAAQRTFHAYEKVIS